MGTVPGGLGPDLGWSGDPMAGRLGVLAVVRMAASGAGVRHDLSGRGLLRPRRTNPRARSSWPTWPPRRFSEAGPGRSPLEVERPGGWRLGGVRGAPVEPSPEGGNPLLEGTTGARMAA